MFDLSPLTEPLIHRKLGGSISSVDEDKTLNVLVMGNIVTISAL